MSDKPPIDDGWQPSPATTPPALWAKLKPLARQMRHDPTPAENALWQHLRNRQINNLKFRRQHSIDRFIVDFYCADAQLVIEVDGSVHDYTPEEDAIRQEFLETIGLRVLRFQNDTVLHSIESVLETISKTVNSLSDDAPTPPLHRMERGPGGEVNPHNPVATNIPLDDYLDRYAADFCEWVKGDVFKMSPVSDGHDEITGYLREIFRAYFALNAIGRVKSAPFVMRVNDLEIAREPDLQIILDSNPGTFTDTAMIGPADICIEVVSPESVERDHGTKFAEYEKAGVGEYWIIDPIRRECRFYPLDEAGIYIAAQVDENDNYHTPKLPKLALHIPTFWQSDLPDIIATVQTVQAMFAS